MGDGAGPSAVRLEPVGAAPALLRVVGGDDPAAGPDGGSASPTVTMRLRRRVEDAAAPGVATDLEYDRFADPTARSAFLRTVRPAGATACDVVGTILPTGARHLLVEAGHLIQVVRMTTRTTVLPEAVRFNVEETCRFFRRCDGFRGAVLHVGPVDAEPDRLLELLVWRSDADLARAATTERFREHVRADARLALDLEVAQYTLTS